MSHQQPHHVELFIVTLEDPQANWTAPLEYLDGNGEATLTLASAHLYWDVTEALDHAALARKAGFESDTQEVWVTLH